MNFKFLFTKKYFLTNISNPRRPEIKLVHNVPPPERDRNSGEADPSNAGIFQIS